ncbi:MAG: hypothetical protein JOZ93_10425 [Sinobacteraceae bacterium]|nr:hypothetical protein [Nevskiaceae bacterium]
MTISMRRLHLKSVAFAASLATIALGVASQAGAACLDAKSLSPKMSGRSTPAYLVPAVYQPDTLGGALWQVSDRDRDDEPSIVGLWQFKFSGFVVDWGTEAFHSDGTEIIFSGGQNPETGDVCQGVWRSVGHNTYTLNHIAMGWVAPGAGFGMRIHFHAILKLNSTGNSFSGNYKVAVYSVSPQDPFDESVEVASGSGGMSGTRVRPD